MAEKIERVYTIPLVDAYVKTANQRTVKASKVLRAFLERHMKSKVVKIGADVNDALWAGGMKKPPRKITVKVVKEDGVVKVSMLVEKKDEKVAAVKTEKKAAKETVKKEKAEKKAVKPKEVKEEKAKK